MSYVCLILNIQYHNVFVEILPNDKCSFVSCCKYLNNHVSKSIFFIVEIPTEMTKYSEKTGCLSCSNHLDELFKLQLTVEIPT